MGKLLSNFRSTVLLSLVLAGVMIYAFGSVAPGGFDLIFWQAVFRWTHVAAGVLWIGLLWYFNFVQIRVMPAIPAELKPAVGKHIAPEALFWFRWSALAFLGGPTLFGFSIALMFGIIVGTYSSIYVGAPVILLWGVKRGGSDDATPVKLGMASRP